MPGPQRKDFSYELSLLLVDGAPRVIANPALQDERLRTPKLVAGFNCSKQAMRKAADYKLSGWIQRALRNPSTRLPAKDVRRRLRFI